ncbi:MAG: pyridoxamine kinase [Eubacteriales bacterium]|nr:pyridoxamine kinase [Eubacteriales bacterium]
MKQVVAAHDLSGVGKASLAAAMPIISAMGSVVLPLPTAVLSTVTGVFEGYRIVDLTEQMKNTIDHWKSLSVNPNCIYSGFLGSHEQVDIIIWATEIFDKAFVVVDPVFADEDRLYPTMTMELVQNMKRLVAHADIITPNVTEAKYLLDEAKIETSVEGIKAWLKRLCDMGPSCAIITSAKLDGKMCVVIYNKEEDVFWRLNPEYIPVKCHGTGDIFASVLTGAIMRGEKVESAATLAAEFVRSAILATLDEGYDLKYGVLVEKALEKLFLPGINKCERF